MKTIETWLPVFSGFYSTIWEPNEENEIEYINELRKDKGFEPAKFDDFNFDYGGYNIKVSKQVTSIIEDELIKAGFVKDITYQGLRSPKYYNYSNDTINIAIRLTQENERNILKALKDNSKLFADYLREHYTSCSGFLSHYDNTIDEFMEDKPLEHTHKLGAILNFLCYALLDLTNDSIYDYVIGNVSLECENYTELTETKNLHDEN